MRRQSDTFGFRGSSRKSISRSDTDTRRFFGISDSDLDARFAMMQADCSFVETHPTSKRALHQSTVGQCVVIQFGRFFFHSIRFAPFPSLGTSHKSSASHHIIPMRLSACLVGSCGTSLSRKKLKAIDTIVPGVSSSKKRVNNKNPSRTKKNKKDYCIHSLAARCQSHVSLDLPASACYLY